MSVSPKKYPYNLMTMSSLRTKPAVKSRKRGFLLLTGFFLAQKNNEGQCTWFQGVSSFTSSHVSSRDVTNAINKKQCEIPFLKTVDESSRHEFHPRPGKIILSEANGSSSFESKRRKDGATFTRAKRSKGPRKNVRRATSNSLYHHGMRIYDHRLLSREEERKMGNAMERGRKLKHKIDTIVASKLLNRSTQSSDRKKSEEGEVDTFDLDQEWNTWLRGVDSSFPSSHQGDADSISGEEETPNPYHRSFLSWLRHGSEDDTEQNAFFAKMRRSYISKVSPKSPFYESPAFLGMLTPDEIKHSLGLEDGTLPMLLKILIEAQEARQELLKCNMKLVLSIAKRWYTTYSGSAATKNGLYGEKNDSVSLDELVQEGTIGLMKAVDKFDYTKETKFSTYATYWITSYVRIAMLRAKTSVLKVPDHVHHLRQKYRDLMARVQADAAPSLEGAAKQLKVKPEKLDKALRSLQPIASLDAPNLTASAKFKGSAAGGDVNGKGLTVGDTLSNDIYGNDRPPEETIDQSILRQNLERLLTTELSPYERDILRLRMGLDDGKARSIREIADLLNMSIFDPNHPGWKENTISMSHVRSTEKNALKRLRNPLIVKSYRLEDFLQK